MNVIKTSARCRLCFLAIALILCSIAGPDVTADTLYLDTFNDGDSTDASPLTWSPMVPQFPGEYDASSGDLILAPPPGEPAVQDFLVTLADDVQEDDVSIRGLLRKYPTVPREGEWIGLLARINPLDPSRSSDEYSGYEAFLRRNGMLTIDRIDPGGQRETLAVESVPFDVTQEDVWVQFDLFGSDLFAWAWGARDPMPTIPQIYVTDSVYTDGGVGLTSTGGREIGNPSVGVFRVVEIADSQISHPTPAACDFDFDLTCDSRDLDALFASGELTQGVPVPPTGSVMDLDSDGTLTVLDAQAWLDSSAAENGFASAYLPGDSNLDGTVDATDLTALALSWQQDGKVWSTGDFTGDGRVDADDVNLLGVNWQRSIPSAAAISVPEPSGLFSALVIGFLTITYRRQRTANVLAQW